VIDESAVDRRVSPAERMLGAGGREHYFRVGQSALECIQKALDIASISPHRIKRILDLPCGHGRVLRYLKAAFPEAEITACDLLRDGVDYCSSMFGATALYSCDDPEDIPLHPGSFDLIWVGSLLTHLDAALWPRFLAVFRNSLCPGGLLVFTTHGRHSYQLLLDSTEYGLSNRQTTLLAYRYEGTGFAYTKYLGSESDYGHSLSHPAWVIHQLTALGGLRLVNFSEKAWDQQQDVFASIREPACEGDIRPDAGCAVLAPSCARANESAPAINSGKHLDTMVLITVITPHLARRAGIEIAPGGMQSRARMASGEEVQVSVIRLKSIRIGLARIDNLGVALYELGVMDKAAQPPLLVDGLLGADVLGQFTTTIDPDGGKLTLQLRDHPMKE